VTVLLGAALLGGGIFLGVYFGSEPSPPQPAAGQLADAGKGEGSGDKGEASGDGGKKEPDANKSEPKSKEPPDPADEPEPKKGADAEKLKPKPAKDGEPPVKAKAPEEDPKPGPDKGAKEDKGPKKAEPTAPDLILQLVNQQRAAEQVRLLKTNPILQTVAQKYAEYLAELDTLGKGLKRGHFLDGKSPLLRARQAKYDGVVAENLALSLLPEAAAVAKDALTGWMLSAPQRGNILEPKYTETGVGAAVSKTGKWYCCQLFGIPAVQVRKVYSRIFNETGEAIRLRIGDNPKPQEVAAGAHVNARLPLPPQGLSLFVLPADPAGMAVGILARNGEDYIITRDEKGYRISKLP
jgi:uncharacterized protein YkwD